MNAGEKAVRLFLAFLPILMTGGSTMPTIQGPAYPGGFFVSPIVAIDSGTGDLSHNTAGYVYLDQANISKTHVQTTLPRKFSTLKAVFADGIMNTGDVVLSATIIKVDASGNTVLKTITDEVVAIPSGLGRTYGLEFDVSDIDPSDVLLIKIERDPTNGSDTFSALLSFDGWLFE
ncbi:MAG: hypothetical protein GVY30_00230 [Chloroflexi bacterium]|jgi:hypothetical protein|nr:hypothetical protein [Chloroflexota bacterium]